MPTVGLRVYSSVFKANLKHRFGDEERPARPESKWVVPDAGFSDGVATKDIVIDLNTGLSLRVFLPDHAVSKGSVHGYSWMAREMGFNGENSEEQKEEGKISLYKGYMPKEGGEHHKLPIMVQFHSGGFVVGRKDSVANDKFCRRLARMCNAIVTAVGFRLAPENKCPCAIEDGLKTLQWLSRQNELILNQINVGKVFRGKEREHVADLRETSRTFGEDVSDPWLEAHGDFSRVVIIGASSGGNIADQVTRNWCNVRELPEYRSVDVIGQILLYPLFSGQIPTHSEVTMGQNSLFFDKFTVELAWKLFLKKEDFFLDSPFINPLLEKKLPQGMPPTLVVSAELDMLRDRCIAYAEFLKKQGINSQINNYKDTVHGFANLEILLDSPQALACAEDISVWMHKRLGK